MVGKSIEIIGKTRHKLPGDGRPGVRSEVKLTVAALHAHA